MDILKDIAELVKEDNEHNIEVKVDSCGVTVYLGCNPDGDGNCLIPIKYSSIDDFAYIPNAELIDKFKLNDFGIDLNEINLIQKIMSYMEKNKLEINELCAKYYYDKTNL